MTERYVEEMARRAAEAVERWPPIVAAWEPMTDVEIEAAAEIFRRIDARRAGEA